MKNKRWWPLVILISTVQLMLLLIAVVLLFAWLSEVTEQKVTQQTCLNNQVIGKQLVDLIESETIRNIRGNTDSDRDKLVAIVASVEIPNHGFVWVLDKTTGEMIVRAGGDLPNIEQALGKLPMWSVQSGTKMGTLVENVATMPGKRNVSGRLSLDRRDHVVSAHFLPQLNAVLVVGQQEARVTKGLAGSLSLAKNFVFAGTLLLGLICTCCTVIILGRISERVSSLNDGLEQEVSNSARELVRTKNAVIFGLAKLAESRDNDTGEHLDRIRSYVTFLVEELAQTHPEVNEEFVRNLALASSLHDIGKVGIPDSILLKPGRLTPEERGIMELHTLIGGECLDAIHSRLGDNAFMHMVRQVAYYHHERWDGTGYPHSLKEYEIPLVARIVAVADVYDALTSKRPYKKAMTHLESKAIIIAGSGKHFDPEVVDVFLRLEDKFEEISRHQQFVSDEEATSHFQRLCEAISS